MTFVVIGFVFASGAQEGGAAEESYVIKVSTSAPEGDQIHKVATRFKEIVEEESDGRIEVQIYPNKQLGTEQENVQDTSSGSIEACIIYTGNYKPFAPSVGVLMLPYLFTSPQDAWKGMDAVFDELNKRVIEESNTRLLGYFDRGFRYLTNSVRPVRTLEDLQGLKIRVSKVDIAIETFKAWGIEPVPMAWDEVPTALQQRVIDGQENPYATIKSFGFYETQDYVTEIHYLPWTGPLIINNDFYESLPADLQEIVDKAGKEVAELGRQVALENEQSAKQFVIDKGMTVTGPPEDEERWQELAQENWPMFFKGSGGKEWVERALSLMGK
jgi:tripartite ATP-independent transporter DctP family solute receptor